MPEPEKLIQDAQKEVLDSYRKEFEQLSVAFRDLDGKAQGTATTAGAFLAASLVYLNRSGSLESGISRFIMLIAVIGLTCAIGFSLQALRVRRVQTQPSGEDVERLLAALGRSSEGEELAKRLVYFYGDVSKLWRDCVHMRREVNQVKAGHLWSAQKSLLLVALSISTLLLSIVIR